MKKFSEYQHLPGTPMTERDEKEQGSAFWNEGKWKNFIVPFLPDNAREMTLIDMGCNAGLFLGLAEEWGFKHVIGVESDGDAIGKAKEYKAAKKYNYKLHLNTMESIVEFLPVSDYTIIANVHYYLSVNEWLRFLDKLMYKTRYCIIVTDENRKNPVDKTSAAVEAIRRYFSEWGDCFPVIKITANNDQSPRALASMVFSSPKIKRLLIDDLDNGNHQQDGFYKQLDDKVPLEKTDYWRRMHSYRINEHHWSNGKFNENMYDRELLYKNVKKFGLIDPVIVNSKRRIVDGNHRTAIMKHLGYKSILAREVL